MAWQLADIWESIADAVPDAEAIVFQDRRHSWRDYDDRAARLAQLLIDNGLTAGSKLSIYSYNHPAWLETQYGAFKARMTPVNVNYRYLEAELTHVITNSDSEALVYQAQFAPRVAAIRDALPNVKLFLEIEDGSGEHLDGALPYEETLRATHPMQRIERAGDDLYMLYTGGTTGMPKGVMYDHETFASAIFKRAVEIRGMEVPEQAEQFGAIAAKLKEMGSAPRGIAACPLMHGTGMWVGAMTTHSLGGCNVLIDNRHFDADELWEVAAREKVTDLVIVGDVFAKPLLQSLEAARDRGEPYRLDSLALMASSGVMWSAEVKRGLLEHLDITIIDAMGSTEGSMGAAILNRETLDANQTAKFELAPTTKVLTEEGEELQPGDERIGLIANGGMVPIGYYKDEKKSAETFKTFHGTRYSIPGDYAQVAPDGTITLLGRGSVCINSGGEKIFPEEVEEALKTHDSIYDCLVVGVPDDRFGERVTAVLSTTGDASLDENALDAHVREQLAAYKIPRSFVTVDSVPRAANGKPDYKGAKAQALEALGISA